jgi:hypothetical protein
MKPRLDDMIAMLERSHIPVPQADSPLGIAQIGLQLVDAQYKYGQLILHLIFLSRKLGAPASIGDSSFGYEVAASLAFTV